VRASSDISGVKFYGKEGRIIILYGKKMSFIYICPVDTIFKLFKVKMSYKFYILLYIYILYIYIYYIYMSP